jgi:hypothetical protein
MVMKKERTERMRRKSGKGSVAERNKEDNRGMREEKT